MSKDGSNKAPVSENREQRFMGVVYVLANEFGIDDIPSIYHHVELLGQAVARHVFEQNHKMSPQKKVHSDRKRFIAIFKRRYIESYDLEYTRKVTPVEGKQINQANKMLLGDGFTPDEYLEWLFDDFLVENPKFSPPTIKSSCSHFTLHQFLVANKERRVAKKRQEQDRISGMDLITRARGLLRGELEAGEIKKLKDALKSYSEKDIMLSEFRKIVEAIEEKNR